MKKKPKFENHTYVYIRVSNVKQIQDMQISAINDYIEKNNIKVEKWFEETDSGLNRERTQLLAMLDKLRAGDTVIVWRFDRISRSSQQLITIAEKFIEKGVHFISINNNVDTTTKEGKLFYVVMAGFAEYEAAIIQERVQEGLLASRKKGIVGGRPRLDSEKMEKALKMYKTEKYTLAEICKETTVSKTTLYRRIKEIKTEEFANQYEMYLEIIDDKEKLLAKLTEFKSEMEIELAIPPLTVPKKINRFIKEAKKAYMLYNNLLEKIEELEDELDTNDDDDDLNWISKNLYRDKLLTTSCFHSSLFYSREEIKYVYTGRTP